MGRYISSTWKRASMSDTYIISSTVHWWSLPLYSTTLHCNPICFHKLGWVDNLQEAHRGWRFSKWHSLLLISCAERDSCRISTVLGKPDVKYHCPMVDYSSPVFLKLLLYIKIHVLLWTGTFPVLTPHYRSQSRSHNSLRQIQCLITKWKSIMETRGK